MTKLIVLYPKPKDENEFATRYEREHLPLAGKNLKGVTKVVSSRFAGSPTGDVPYFWMSEVFFESMDALQACAASEGGKQTLAHAATISTGGAPSFLVAVDA